jgi:hypothetical protein
VVVLGSLSVVVAAVLPIVVLVGMLWITWDEIANRKETSDPRCPK